MQSICSQDFSFASVLRPGDRIVVGQGTAEPRTLMRRLFEEARAGLLPEVVLFVGPIYSDCFIGDLPECLRIESYGGIGGASALARAGRLCLYPTHVSRIDQDFREGRLRADVVLLPLRPALSGPGLNLGIARDYTLAAARQSRAIIALPATTRKGQSRIVTRVDTVTCTRADADTIVTEHGVAELRGQPVSERVRRMIAVAAPECRDALEHDWYAAQGVDG